MGSKIFLDTNILIDYFDKTRGNHFSAREIIMRIEKNSIKGFISESVINTTVYLIKKGYTIIELRKNMDELISMFTVLPCSNTTIHKAYRLPTNDLKDAVLYQLALENKLDYFITEDKKGFKKLSSPLLPVLSGIELLKLII